jgi:DnaK suppressor protein
VRVAAEGGGWAGQRHAGAMLDDAQRAAIAARITEDRSRAEERARALERDLANIISASADAVRDDEHDPEGATIAFERAQVTALLQDAHDQVTALDAAQGRLAGPDAGRCTRCGHPIPFERLEARPAVDACVACASGSSRARR